MRAFNSEAEDYDLAPNSRRLVVSTHGELFTVPVDEGDIKQITDSPARDRAVDYSPDGKWIAYVSDASGREELYVIPIEGGTAQKLTDIDALKSGFNWSPDSKEIAFTATDSKLRKVNISTKALTELDASRYGNISTPEWSPDGKWLAYSKQDASRTSDIYVLDSTGTDKTAHKVTFDSYDERAPRFSPDGRKLYFIRSDSTGGGGGGGGFGNASVQIYSVWLEKLDRDPDDPEERPDNEAAQAPTGEGGEGAGPARRPGPRPPHETKMDWAGMKHRTRQVTRLSSPIFSYALTPDSRTIIFVSNEASATGSTPVIYSIQEDGRRLSRITAGGPPAGEGEGGPGGGGGFGGGISDLNISRDGRTLFFSERNGVYSVPIGGSAAAAAGAAGRGAATGEGGGGARRRISFNVRVRINRPAEWAEMFGDAWRTMKYRFYDPAMHGMDWDAAKAKYEPLVKDVGDRQELLNIINEMIGELNASHTGAAPPPRGGGGGGGGVSTGNLGIELEPDKAAGRYRVSYVYEDGPADKDWVKVSVGDYLIAIGGKEVKAGDEYWQLLNDRLNRKVEITLNKQPTAEGAWKTRIETINGNAYSTLRYDRWVKERRQKVDELSGGRIGYLHIRAMDQPSLRKFEKEIREFRNKEALIIDQRWNGGGNIEQELLAILVQREYQVWQPRGVEASGRPFAGYFGPKVVLQNWRSASNAEMFPAGFRALGLGKVVGTPTMGAVIGTGSYSLIDGSTVRTPGVGVYLADQKRTNMENYGVQPDIRVDNAPEDNLAGRDRQLEAAVDELLKQLGGGRRNQTTTNNQ